MSEQKPITGKTKHTELTIDQIAAMLPGLAKLMEEIGYQFWIVYYAGQGGNWDLAVHKLKQVKNLFKQCSTMRPQMAKMLDSYAEECLTPLEAHIAAKDFEAFDAAYQRAVVRANEYHVVTGHTEVKWKLPPSPPQHLDLSPQPPRPKKQS
jgi:hypothetical protein